MCFSLAQDVSDLDVAVDVVSGEVHLRGNLYRKVDLDVAVVAARPIVLAVAILAIVGVNRANLDAATIRLDDLNLNFVRIATVAGAPGHHLD